MMMCDAIHHKNIIGHSGHMMTAGHWTKSSQFCQTKFTSFQSESYVFATYCDMSRQLSVSPGQSKVHKDNKMADMLPWAAASLCR